MSRVGGRRSAVRAGLAFGQEYRAALAAADEPGQQARGAGGPVHVLGVAAFGDHAGAAGVEFQVLDVQGQEFGGAGGGFVEHPPQGFLPQGDVAAGQQPLDRGPVDGPGLVALLGLALHRGGQRRRRVAVLAAPGEEGAERGAALVPGGRRCGGPQGGRASPSGRLADRDRCWSRHARIIGNYPINHRSRSVSAPATTGLPLTAMVGRATGPTEPAISNPY